MVQIKTYSSRQSDSGLYFFLSAFFPSVLSFLPSHASVLPLVTLVWEGREVMVESLLLYRYCFTTGLTKVCMLIFISWICLFFWWGGEHPKLQFPDVGNTSLTGYLWFLSFLDSSDSPIPYRLTLGIALLLQVVLWGGISFKMFQICYLLWVSTRP